MFRRLWLFIRGAHSGATLGGMISRCSFHFLYCRVRMLFTLPMQRAISHIDTVLGRLRLANISCADFCSRFSGPRFTLVSCTDFTTICISENITGHSAAAIRDICCVHRKTISQHLNPSLFCRAPVAIWRHCLHHVETNVLTAIIQIFGYRAIRIEFSIAQMSIETFGRVYRLATIERRARPRVHEPINTGAFRVFPTHQHGGGGMMRGTGQGGTAGANSRANVSNGVAPVTSSDQCPPGAMFRLARNCEPSFHSAKPSKTPVFIAVSRLCGGGVAICIGRTQCPIICKLSTYFARTRYSRTLRHRHKIDAACGLSLGQLAGTPGFALFFDVRQDLVAETRESVLNVHAFVRERANGFCQSACASNRHVIRFTWSMIAD